MRNEHWSQVPKQAFETYLNAMRYSEEIYDLLSSNRFSRAKPYDRERIVADLSQCFGVGAHFTDRDITLSVLWGGSKKNKDGSADLADVLALDNLVRVREEANEVLKHFNFGRSDKDKLPFLIKLLFCDMHHFLVNRMPWEKINTYYEELGERASSRGIGVERLSEKITYRSENETMRSLSDFDHILGYLEENPNARLQIRTEYKNNPEWSSALNGAAEKHSLWKDYFPIPEIAILYAQLEVHYLQKLKEGRKCLVVGSLSNPELQDPIARISGVPMFYLRSNCPQHSFNECPWYVDMPFEDKAYK
jgi:hypothetical protein